MKITNNGTGYVIHRDDGTTIQLTWNEVSLLHNHMNSDTLRSNVEEAMGALAEDGQINPDAFPGGFDEFVTEICGCFADDVECTGAIPDDDEIQDRILDEARWYDGVLTEEEEG